MDVVADLAQNIDERLPGYPYRPAFIPPDAFVAQPVQAQAPANEQQAQHHPALSPMFHRGDYSGNGRVRQRLIVTQSCTEETQRFAENKERRICVICVIRVPFFLNGAGC